MRKMRIGAMLMALVMLVMMATPALAEGKLNTITLNNIGVDLNGAQTKIGLEVKLSAAEDASYVSANVDGANNILDLQFAQDDERITLGMDGLSSNYTISRADLSAMMQSAFEGMEASGDMPFEMEDLQALVEAYMGLIEEAAKLGEQQPDVESLTKVYEEMGFVPMGEEEVLINGQPMTLTRIDLNADAAGLDKIIGYTLNQSPAMKAYLVEYMAILSKISGDDAFDFDPDHLYESMFASINAELVIEAKVWTDEKGENMRMEMTETMVINPAEGAEGEPVAITVPFTMEVYTDAEGEHVAVDMVMDDVDGQSMKMHIAANDANLEVGTKGDMIMTMDVNGDGLEFQCDFDYDEKGTGSFSTTTDVRVGGVSAGAFAFGVTSTGGDVNTHSVLAQVSIPAEAEGEQQSFGLSFDLTTESAEAAGALFDAAGKPTVDIAQMAEEDAQALQSELMTKGIISYGALMQVDGVAELVSDMIMAVQSAIGEYMNADPAAAPEGNPGEVAA